MLVAIGNGSFVTGSGDEIPHPPHRRIRSWSTGAGDRLFGAQRASAGGRRADSSGGKEAAWSNPAENGRAASRGIPGDSSAWIPELIASAGAQVTETYIDFFTSTIRNRNTRAAYARACWQFFDWCAAHGLQLTTVRPFHVPAWLEDFPV